MRVFRNILVMPTQGLRNGVGWPKDHGLSGFVRGGPIWPGFALRTTTRHCRGFLPVPVDKRPMRVEGPEAQAERGIWCGPVSPHFGHMIDDFASRIAASLERPEAGPLVFSLGPDVARPPAPFFWQMLEHLGAHRERVLIVDRPTRFARLAVLPQEERVNGPGPRAAYLDRLDAVARRRGVPAKDIDILFVSRAAQNDGKLVGESYLDGLFAGLGIRVIHPETLDLASQLDTYSRAKTMIFSEGSALHGLQLLGRTGADLVVLVRRRGKRFARRALAARTRSLAYWDLAAGLIHGVHLSGKPMHDRALVLIDRDALFACMRGLGVDLAPHWDEAAYRASLDHDLKKFVWYNKQLNLHPAALPTIQACLTANGIDLDVAAC